MAEIPGKKGPATHKQMLKEINKSLQHQISNRADPNSVKTYGIANLSAVEQLSLQNLASALPGDRRSFPTRSTKNALEEIRSYLQQFRCDGDPDSSSSSNPILGASGSYDRNNGMSSFLKSSSVTDLNVLHQDIQDAPIDIFQRELSNAYLAGNERDQPVFNYKTDETLNFEAVVNGHAASMPNRKLSSKTTACAVNATRSQIFPQQPPVHHLPSGAHNQFFQRPVKGHEGNITQAQRIFGVNSVAPRSHQSPFSPALVSSMTPSNRYPLSFAQLPKKNSQENSSSSPSAIVTAKRIPVNVLASERNDRPRSAVFNNEVPANQNVPATLINDIKNVQRPRSDIFPACEDEGDVRAVSHGSDHQCGRCDAVQGIHPAISHKAAEQYGLRQSPWEGVVMRRKTQEPKKVQDRWSAEILHQGAGRGSLNYLDKRTSVEIIPCKPPPPYPGVSVSKSTVSQPSNLTHMSGQSAVERDCVLCSDGSNSSFSYASSLNDVAIDESSKGVSTSSVHGNMSAGLYEARSHQVNDLDGRALSLLDIRSPTSSSQCSSGYPVKHWDPPPYDISAQKQLLLKSDRQFMPVESTACMDNVNLRSIEDSTLGRMSSIASDEEKESSCSGFLEENVFTSITMDPSNSISVDDQISSSSETHASDLLAAADGVERSYSPLPTSGSPCATMVIHPESLREEKLKQFSAEGREPLSGRLKNYTPQAYKFYMEQHVENLLKQQDQRIKRQRQLEVEMARVGLSSEAQEEMRKMLYKKESNYIRLRRAKMDKSMFSKVKTIGIGAFGEVSLVRKFDTKALYAMKTLRKSEVIRRNQVAHVKAERDILAEADNEWVVKLYYSFQDDHNLYFVMDYVPGGDLMALLIKLGIFDAVLAKFYVSELVLAIESVHKLGFIHRDIKPDNVLIGRDGHIKLTDFGLCTGFRWTHDSKYYQSEGEAGHSRQFSMEPDGGWEAMLSEVDCDCSSVRIKYDLCKPLERRAARRHMRCTAHSLVGTPNYIAPEVLMRIPYSQLCDWWSVGVILYEMLVGMPPFVAPTPAETQLKVINWRQTLNIPRGRLHPDAADLIRQLCSAPEDRIGQKGATEIKSHSYFDHVNFLSIHQEVAPYIPRIKHATDTSNFDPVPDKMSSGPDTDSGFQEKEEMKGEFAFFGFTFRHFFDDGGHANPFVDSPVDEAMEVHSRQQHVEGAQSGNKRPAASSQKSMTTPNKVSAPNVAVSNEEKLPIYV